MTATVEISKRLVLINSASSLVARVMNVSVMVWMYQYLLRRITPEEYSIYPVVMAIMTFTPLLSAILTGGIARYAVAFYAKGDTRGVTQVVSTMLPLLIGASVAIGGIGALLGYYVDSILTIPPHRAWDARVMVWLLIAGFAARLPLAATEIGVHIRQRFVLRNMIEVSGELFRIAVLFALLLGIGPRIIYVVVATVSANFLQAAAATIASMKLVPSVRFRRTEFRTDLVRELLSFGTWTLLSQISTLIHNASDPIILNKLATPIDVTTLHLGSVADSQIRTTSARVVTPIQPVLTAMHVSTRSRRLQNAYMRASRYQLWAAMLLAVPLIGYREEIIRLYVGGTYMDAATVMGLLMVSYPFMYSTILLGRIAIAKGEIRGFSLLSLLINVLNLALTLTLVGVYQLGAIGSAAGSLASRILAQPILYWPLMRRLIDLPMRTWLRETLLPGVAPAITAYATIIGARHVLDPTTWTGIAGGTAIAGCVYVAVLLGFSLREQDRNDLSRIVTRLDFRRAFQR